MAIDLFCYTNYGKVELQEAVRVLSIANPEIFAKSFLIGEIFEAGPVEREISLEHGFDAVSIFLIRLAEKSAAGRMKEVADLVKAALVW